MRVESAPVRRPSPGVVRTALALGEKIDPYGRLLVGVSVGDAGASTLGLPPAPPLPIPAVSGLVSGDVFMGLPRLGVGETWVGNRSHLHYGDSIKLRPFESLGGKKGLDETREMDRQGAVPDRRGGDARARSFREWFAGSIYSTSSTSFRRFRIPTTPCALRLR